MSRTLHGRALVEGRLRPAAVTVDGGRIREVLPTSLRAAGRDLLVPGFIDLHVHGGGGADFMDGGVEAAAQVAAFHARHGTTTLAATTLSGAREAVTAAVRAAAELARVPRPNGARVRAIHLEGPYLNPGRCGAQDPDQVRPADVAELGEWVEAADGLPCLMTVAPEAAGVEDLMARFRDRVRFALGHSACTHAQACSAMAAGAHHVTHLFNAMSSLHHREPGLVGAALAHETATAELIADGHHIHPSVLGLAARLLGARGVLVTDAMRAAGMPDGTYLLHRHRVDVRDGAARMTDGTLAGSVLTMDAAVRTMVGDAGVALEQVLAMATEHPARVLGLLPERGCIVPGAAADLLVLDQGLRIRSVLIAGREVEA